MAQTSGEATNVRFRSAEGIYKAKAKQGFDSEGPVSTDLFAYICAYLRTFALKTFFFPSREVPGFHQSKQVNHSASRKNSAKPCTITLFPCDLWINLLLWTCPGFVESWELAFSLSELPAYRPPC
jgi:hypothetical protein